MIHIEEYIHLYNCDGQVEVYTQQDTHIDNYFLYWHTYESMSHCYQDTHQYLEWK